MKKRTKVLMGVTLALAVIAVGVFTTNTSLLKGAMFRTPTRATSASCPLSSGTVIYNSSYNDESIYIDFVDFVAVVSNTLKGGNSNGILPNCNYQISMNGGTSTIGTSAVMNFVGPKSFSIYEGGEAMSITNPAASTATMSVYITEENATLSSIINYGSAGSMNFLTDYDNYSIVVK